MMLHGWGRYPKFDAILSLPLSNSQCIDIVNQTKSLIPRGLGRSYGDSILASDVLDTRHLNHFISFDAKNGLLCCAAGVSLHEIINNFVPRGWFLPVTPGTRFVTVGGAIACDVHGKNHYLEGTFSNHVTEIELLLGNGERVIISPRNRPELFQATCGGMGLTGIILSATLSLKPITSNKIIETTIKASHLEEVLKAFEDHGSSQYSVAWIDCLAKGKHLGRSLFMIGDHAQEGPLDVQQSNSLTIPFDMPFSLLNQTTARVFNSAFYVIKKNRTRSMKLEQFFYPLDRFNNWNRLYGPSGFIQYQFVLPASTVAQGLQEVLEYVSQSKQGAYLAVLKRFGPANQNDLSFPMEGYSLALDFKMTPEILLLLNQLDVLVLKYGGRVYLAKDSRMSEEVFKQSYPNWHHFEEVRAQFHAIGKFSSLQSQRLGLE